MTVQVMPPRIERNELYMGVARLFARRSTCLRGQVGCVAVANNHIVAAGYNGAPAGMKHCTEVGCGGAVKTTTAVLFPNGCTRAIHAEQNMVAYAAKIGISLYGCTVYCTAGPCLPCAQAMIGAGVFMLVYDTPYRLPQGLELLDAACVKVERYQEDRNEFA